MTPEQVCLLYRAYRLYYQDKYDFAKYKGKMKDPGNISATHEYGMYRRIATKLNDEQVHALFTLGFYYHPSAYIADFAGDDALKNAIRFAERHRHGDVLYDAEIGQLLNAINHDGHDMQAWLYGVDLGNGQRASMADVIDDIAHGIVSPDMACMLLLVPYENLNWPQYWKDRGEPIPGLGMITAIRQLERLDRLLYIQRTAWRTIAYDVNLRFWPNVRHNIYTIQHTQQENTLF